MKMYEYNHPIPMLLAMQAFANIAAGALLLFLVSVPLGLFCIVSGVAYIVASRKSTARRYIVDPFFFRVPRYPRFSNYILWRRYVIQYVNFFVVLCSTAISFVAFESTLWRFLAIMALATFTCMMLTAAIKQLIKFHVDTFFRILVFRRNSAGFAVSYKAVVLSTCGLYGQVLFLTDETLSEVWEGSGARRRDWVISEMYQPLVADPENENEWREVVITQLAFADFVVLDWPGEITENMVWELEQTLARIPKDRLMLLTAGENNEQVKQVLNRLSEADRPLQIVESVSPTDVKGMRMVLFIHRFSDMMDALKVSKRPEIPTSELTSALLGEPSLPSSK